MISPIIGIFSSDENVIVSNIVEYFEVDKEDSSIEVSSNKEYGNSTLEVFKENLEKKTAISY